MADAQSMTRRGFVRQALGAAGAAAMPRRASAQPKRRPDILWLMTDDLRADGLGCYGQPWARTPNLDAVAAQGVRFEVAVTQCVVCVPSRASMKSALYCHTLGVMAMGTPAEGSPPPPQELPPSLLSVLAQNGYRLVNIGKTHAYQRDWHLNIGDPKLNRPPKPPLTDRDGPAYPQVLVPNRPWVIGGTTDEHPDDSRPARYVDAAIEQLRTRRDEPRLLRVSFHEPHVPILVPRTHMMEPDAVTLPVPTEEELGTKPQWERGPLSEYAGALPLTREQLQIARGTYYGVVSLVDEHIGRLLEALRETGRLEDTIIVFTSDQGLQMGEHGLHKKRNFYEQTVRVPLLIAYGDELPHGRTVKQPVELLDLMPTVLDLCGLQPLPGRHGRSMVRLMRGEHRRWRDAVFSEIDHAQSMYDCLRADSGRRVMIRTERWKMVWFKDERASGPEGALYDLRADPGETRNLYNDPKQDQVRRQLERRAEGWDKRT